MAPYLPYVLPIIMLFFSNIFMTFAWYGHLNFANRPMMLLIVASWGIAFFEYCLVVPANQLGHQVYSTAELKIIQEIITLLVFVGFSIFYLKEGFSLNYLIGFAFIAVGAAFVFKA